VLDSGCWVLGAGFWLLGAGCWWLVTGGWLLVAGYWWLVTGGWLLNLNLNLIWSLIEAAEKVSNLFLIYFPLFFLALPQNCL
jgi:hypothetical protein